MSDRQKSRTEHAPNIADQVLEAAQDDPTRTELVGMLEDIPQVTGIGVEHDDIDWAPTTIVVRFADRHGSGTGIVMKACRRAGWIPTECCFSVHRISFIEEGA